MRAVICAFLLVAMVVAGCGEDDDDAATPATASSESDEVATSAGADFDVVFDGEACTVTGPASVPAGEYIFVLTNTSEIEDALVIVRGADSWVTLRYFRAPRLDLEENQTQYGFVVKETGHHRMEVRAFGSEWECPGFEGT